MSLRFCVERNGLWLQIASWGVGNVAPAVILNEWELYTWLHLN